MKTYLIKYSNSSTVHGFSYISSSKVNLVEKLFWIIFLFISLVCSALLISKMFTKIRDFPIVMHLSSNPIQISKIDFPAVTFCVPTKVDNLGFNYTKLREGLESGQLTLQNISKVKRDHGTVQFRLHDRTGENMHDLDENTKNISDLQLKFMQVMELLHNSDFLSNRNVNISTEDFQIINLNLFHHFDYARSSQSFIWIEIFCPDLGMIPSPYGMCESFNFADSNEMFDFDETSEDFNFTRVPLSLSCLKLRRKFPMRASLSSIGVGAKLSRNLMSDKGEDLGPFENLKNELGIKVFIHHPYELPTEGPNEFMTLERRSIRFWINPKITTIDNSLVDADPYERNCFLPHEKSLKFFKFYTKNNCIHECRSAFILKNCGCVPYYMVRSKDTKICGVIDKKCFDHAKLEFKVKIEGKCDCLRPCNEILYNLESELLTLYKNVFDALRENKGSWSSFVAYFKQISFNENVMTRQYDFVDMVSFIGGLFGLFAGFSLISFMEFIYWFILKPLTDLRNRKRISVIEHKEAWSEVSQIQKIRVKWSKLTLNYMQESSVHSFNFIASTASWVEKLFWLSTFVASITCCSILISKIDDKIPNSRIIAIDDSLLFDKNITFPAFSILSPRFNNLKTGYPFVEFLGNWNILYGFSRKRMRPDKLVREFFNSTEELLDALLDFAIHEDRFKFTFIDDEFQVIPFFLEYLSKQKPVYANWMSRSQSSTWKSKFVPKFTTSMTRKGFVFTFNSRNPDEILNFNQISKEFKATRDIQQTLKLRNSFEIPDSSYPLTVNSRNDQQSHFQFRYQMHEPPFGYTEVKKPAFGIHSPDSIATFESLKNFIQIDYGMTVDIKISPEITITDENLRHVSPKERDCYFDGEKTLRFFNRYTFDNCELECYANMTKKMCNCSRFDMPRSNDDEVCKELVNYPTQKLCEMRVKFVLSLDENFSTEKNCSCLPNCQLTTYHAKFVSKFHADQYLNETILNIHLNIDSLVVYKRYQQFTISDVISYVGGLLGLFAGISVLSIVELFYFFTLRVLNNLIRRYIRN